MKIIILQILRDYYFGGGVIRGSQIGFLVFKSQNLGGDRQNVANHQKFGPQRGSWTGRSPNLSTIAPAIASDLVMIMMLDFMAAYVVTAIAMGLVEGRGAIAMQFGSLRG